MSKFIPGSIQPVLKQSINDDFKYQTFVPNLINYPYHLNINRVLSCIGDQKMIFHIAGDTGGLQRARYQQQVIDAMTNQIAVAQSLEDQPRFLFHAGDVVYNYGEEANYYEQFFKPFEHYPAPIFAIAGNHDGDINPLAENQPKTLDSFLKVFCSDTQQTIPLAAETGRKTNIQPNVYFTLQTPLANIIGLYSNATKFGRIDDVQKKWFINELQLAEKERGEKATIVCLHHSPFSADSNHGSSTEMKLFLDACFAEANAKPDIIYSGHVHNYQRYSRCYTDGTTVPFIVSGGGGYAELHKVIDYREPVNQPLFSLFSEEAVLENYNDQTHGFIAVTIEKNQGGLVLKSDYFSIVETDQTAKVSLFDTIEINVRRKR